MATKTVEISGFKFVPDRIVIEVGDRVKWVNRDGAAHTASRDDKPSFDTGLLGKDEESKEIQFTEASGSDGFRYFCRPHTFMVGHVVVTLSGSNTASFSREENLAKQ